MEWVLPRVVTSYLANFYPEEPDRVKVLDVFIMGPDREHQVSCWLFASSFQDDWPYKTLGMFDG